MYSTRSKILIRSKDRTSGPSHNFEATLPQRIKAGTYQLRHVGLPSTYYNIHSGNNSLTVTLRTITDSKDDGPIILDRDVTITISPSLYSNMGSVTTAVYNALNEKRSELEIDEFIGINSDNTSAKVTIFCDDPNEIYVDVNSPLARFLGFTIAKPFAQSNLADTVYSMIRTKYVTIDFNSSDRYSELKYGAPLVTFVVPLSAQTGILNYAPQPDFEQTITFETDISYTSIRLMDEDGNPFDLNGGEWYMVLEKIL